MRHAEEVELLLEEMHRVLAFLGWDQDQWKNHACHIRQRVNSITHSPTPSPAQVKTAAFEEGLRAYALHQASICYHLFSMFVQQWHGVPAFIAMANQGLAEKEVAVDNRELRRNPASRACKCGIRAPASVVHFCRIFSKLSFPPMRYLQFCLTVILHSISALASIFHA